jgi:hypothetical protein
MRYLEIILKLIFLGVSIFLFIYHDPISIGVTDIFLLICMSLGIVLMFNKDSSYHFKQTKKDLLIRKIEGGLLIVFAMAIGVIHFIILS